MSAPGSRASPALEWIARLPLLGEPELARLLGIEEVDARGVRRLLERQGWIEWFVPGTDAIEQRRLSFVREEAMPELAAAGDIAQIALPAHLPVLRRDTLARIARVELTASVNRFFSELTAWPDLPRLELEDARSLPLTASPAERWWLPALEGYGCLRAGALRAPFFVAWDRTAAPDQHRTRRVGAWIAAAPTVAAHWGAEGLPPLLLVCAGQRARSTWERSIGQAADRTAARPAEILLISARELAVDGPAGGDLARSGDRPVRLTAGAARVGGGAIVPTVAIARRTRSPDAADDHAHSAAVGTGGSKRPSHPGRRARRRDRDDDRPRRETTARVDRVLAADHRAPAREPLGPAGLGGGTSARPAAALASGAR